MQTREWFMDRIGKRIFRDGHDCDCKSCISVSKNGTIIENETQADYMYHVQNDFKSEGLDLNYRDKL